MSSKKILNSQDDIPRLFIAYILKRDLTLEQNSKRKNPNTSLLKKLSKEKIEKREKKNKIIEKEGLSFLFYCELERFGEGKINSIIAYLLKIEVITSVYIQVHSSEKENLLEYRFNPSDITGMIFPFLLGGNRLLEIQKAGCFLEYLLQINEKKLDSYITTHLNLWKKGKSKGLLKNILKPFLQLRKAVENIFSLLNQYLGKNLVIPFHKDNNDSHYFEAFLYLETINAIKITSIDEKQIYVNILPKFYEDFKMGQDGTLVFDFENLMSLEERKNRICYQSETTLIQENNTYTLKRNTLPFFLFQLLKKSPQKIISFIDIENAFEEIGKSNRRNISKDVQNLRGNLKERFGIEGDENNLFIIKNDTISLQEGIFAF